MAGSFCFDSATPIDAAPIIWMIVVAAVGGNENAQDGVYGRGEEDWCNHDEEALYDEVSYSVWI